MTNNQQKFDKEKILENLFSICERCERAKYFNGTACRLREDKKYCYELKSIVQALDNIDMKLQMNDTVSKPSI